jgi:hypothetical protein
LYKIAAVGVVCSLYRNRPRYNSLRYAGRDYSLPVEALHATTLLYHQMMLQLSQTKPCHSFHRNPDHFPFIELDAFVVMPNHVHGIIAINRIIGMPIVVAWHATPLPPNDTTAQSDETMSFISPKSGSFSVVLRSYKSAVTKHAHKLDSHFSWQRGFYDTINCTIGQGKRIRKNILDNIQNYNKKI